MGSYDFVTADKFGKDSWPFFGPLSQNLALFWARFGPLAKRRSGNLATLIGKVESRLRTRAAVQPLWDKVKQCETQLSTIQSSQMKQNKIFSYVKRNNNGEGVDGNEQCN